MITVIRWVDCEWCFCTVELPLSLIPGLRLPRSLCTDAPWNRCRIVVHDHQMNTPSKQGGVLLRWLHGAPNRRLAVAAAGI